MGVGDYKAMGKKKSNEVLGYHELVWGNARTETKKFFFSDWRVWLGSLVAAFAGGYVTASLLDLLDKSMIHPIIQSLIILIGAIVGYAFLYFVILFGEGFLFIPAKLYREEKRKADKYNWNDVNIASEYFEDKLGCKVRIENAKANSFGLHVEIQYLELDGVKEDYEVSGKNRMLLWIVDPKYSVESRDANWNFGYSLSPRDEANSESIGCFELSNVSENAQGVRHRIVFCDWGEDEKKRPLRKYAYFTKFAQGELKIHGIHLTASGLSSLNRKYETKQISGNLVYQFRIDANNNQQVMTRFEPGPLDLHADSKEDALNERIKEASQKKTGLV